MHAARRLLVLALVTTPVAAFAHPGHDAGAGFIAGLAHPMLGIDHLAAALLTGAWAAQRGGAARLAMPAAFVVLLLLGFLCAPLAVRSPGPIEQGIAASVLVTGLALAFAWRLPVSLCATLAGGFAFFHGLAHGVEHPSGSVIGYPAGLAFTTTTLLAAGVLGGLAIQHSQARGALRWAGMAGVVAGATLLT